MPNPIPALAGCPLQNIKTTVKAARTFLMLRNSAKLDLAQLRLAGSASGAKAGQPMVLLYHWRVG
jgi:hypothetical protein